MAQTSNIVKTLKRALKAHGKTYADVAAALVISEASVKRIFAEQNFSLERLDQICQLIGLEISDVIKLMEEQSGKISQLSYEQESLIAEDLTLLLIVVCVLNRWTLENIVEYYQINQLECIRYLAFLDRLKIIELLPKNKIKVLVSPNFAWIKNGPIQQFFQKRIAAEYFTSKFSNDDEQLLVLNAMLTESSNTEFQRKMQKLLREFDELNREDISKNFEEKSGYTAIIALRAWNYGLFKPLLKKGE